MKTTPLTVAEIDRLKGNNSRYGYLVENYGEAFADRFMRGLEVASWNLRPTTNRTTARIAGKEG